jgi:rod shape-determining protein MreC
MPASRDDFGIVFRSALLQKGAAQKFSLLYFLIFGIIIFFLDVYNISFMKPVRAVINDGIYRISIVASAPTRFFPSISNNISHLFKIKNENIRLRKELEDYKNKEFRVEYLINQNKILKQFLDSEGESEKEVYVVNTNIIVAKVLLDKDSPYLKSIIINKGSKAGVLKGMPVLDNDYLIGRVVETNYLSSRVLLLTDLNSRIPVTLDTDGTQAILKGTGGSQPVLEYLPEEYNVKDGINIFTSGKDQIFTPGTPIGRTNNKGFVTLHSDANQLSFIKIDLTKQKKESF